MNQPTKWWLGIVATAFGCDATPLVSSPTSAVPFTSAPLASAAPASTPPTAATTAIPSSPISPPVLELGASSPDVRVDDAGREPRRRLTYQPDGGPRDVELAWSQSGAFLPQPQAFRYVVRWERRAHEPATWGFSMREVSLPTELSRSTSTAEQQIMDQLRSAIEAVAGEAALVDGVRLRVSQTASIPATPSVPHMLHEMSVVFPPEAVGIGAKWTVRVPPSSPDTTGSDRRLYELVAADASEVRLKATFDRTLTQPGGTTETKGTATLTIRLSDPLPASFDQTAQQTVRFPAGGGAAPPDLVMQTRLVLTKR